MFPMAFQLDTLLGSSSTQMTVKKNEIDTSSFEPQGVEKERSTGKNEEMTSTAH